jgi:hypothetical protein
MRLISTARLAPCGGGREAGPKSDRHSGAIGLSLPRDHVPVTIAIPRLVARRP